MQNAQELIIIFGPPAVGKMTVGKLLVEKLNYRLFHNHMVKELVKKIFPASDTNFWPTISKIRNTIFEQVAASYLPGFVITYIWDLNAKSDSQFVDSIVSMFEEKLWRVNFVELEAKLGTRMKRNRGKDRIEEKPEKADIERSEAELLESQDYKLNTTGDFEYSDRYVKINSTNLTADQTADMIIDHFNFKRHR